MPSTRPSTRSPPQLAKNGQPFATALAAQRTPARTTADQSRLHDRGRQARLRRTDRHPRQHKTRDDVIRREFDFVEGDAYNRALIDRGERRLKQLGYFKTVRIRKQARLGARPCRRRRCRRGGQDRRSSRSWAAIPALTRLGHGLGRRPQFSRDRRHREGVSDHRPICQGLRSFRYRSLRARAAAFARRRSVRQGDVCQQLSVVRLDRLRRQDFTAGTPLTDQLGVTWSYSIYNQGLSLDPSVGIASLPIRQAAAAGPMWVSSVGTGVTYATLDNPRNPTNGVRVQSNNEFAGLGGAAKFARHHRGCPLLSSRSLATWSAWCARKAVTRRRGAASNCRCSTASSAAHSSSAALRPMAFGPATLRRAPRQDNVGGNIYWTTTAELQAPMPLVTADAA